MNTTKRNQSLSLSISSLFSPCLIFAFLLCILSFSVINAEENVKIVKYINTEDNFYEAIKNNRNNLILFSKLDGKSCKDCKKTLEIIEKTAIEFEGDCEFLFVDCDIKSHVYSVCQKYEVSKYPSISLVSEALAVYPYTMMLTTDKLTSFIKRYSVAKTTIVQSNEEINKLVKENRVVVVGFFADPSSFHPAPFHSSSSPPPPSFDDLIRSYRRTAAYLLHNYLFLEMIITTENVDQLSEYNATLNSIVLFKNIGGNLSTQLFTGHISRKVLKSWVLSHAPALLYSATSDNLQSLNEVKLPIFTVYFHKSEKAEGNIDVFFDLQSTADLFRTTFSFAYSSISEESGEEYANLKRMGFDLSSFPVMTIFNLFSKDIYISKENVNFESMKKFASDYLDGKLTPHRVKQSLPDNSLQLVKVVVFDNYKEIVQSKENDVAIVFYLPEESCRHCADFLQNFEKAAKIIEEKFHLSFPHLIFAKMDMFANQIAPGIRIRNFPSLLFFARDNKYKEVLFSGKRTVENIVDWLVNHATESKSKEEIQTVVADL